jgi:glycerophosphoryl diester phosphodiesterase
MMRQVLRIGHRGAAGHAPENTLAAIEKGIALGVDLVEIDVRRTADEVLVILHDRTVNRTTNGRGRIDQLCLQEVKQLKAGSGERIPTLQEALQAADGRTGLILELKVTGVARQTVESVHSTELKDSVLYASFFHEELTQVRAADPDAARMLLFDRLPRAPVAYAVQYEPSHVGVRHHTATRRLVDAFHRAGLLVFVYTANSPTDISHARSVGVDGVISDFPERIEQHIELSIQAISGS